MNVDSILISEYATADSDLSVTVLRTLNVMHAENFPAQLPSMCVTAIIHAHLSEAGSTHNLRLVLMNDRRHELAVLLEKGFQLGTPDVNHPVGIPLRHTVIHRLVNVEFDRPGSFAFELYIDGTYHAAAAFGVIQRSG